MGFCTFSLLCSKSLLNSYITICNIANKYEYSITLRELKRERAREREVGEKKRESMKGETTRVR